MTIKQYAEKEGVSFSGWECTPIDSTAIVHKVHPIVNRNFQIVAKVREKEWVTGFSLALVGNLGVFNKIFDLSNQCLNKTWEEFLDIMF